ncbi:MAG: ROK family protein [Vicinamibacteria bacterium]
MAARIGVDLGGTKIEVLALDAAGHEQYRKRVPTPQGDYDATLEAIATLVHEADDALHERASVGVGTPGSISRATGLLRGANSVCLNGKPIREDLSRRLGRDVRVTNDANCFALSEAVDGAGAGAEVVFGVILGTGVGAGVVVRGAVLDGPNGIAGEWGHNPLPWPRDVGTGRGSVVAPEAIIASARGGDAACEATLARYEERLARALAHVINILDPDVVVLGGGLSNLDRLYVSVPPLWAPWVFSDRVDTQLVRHVHGDASGVRGAAWLWPGGRGE